MIEERASAERPLKTRDRILYGLGHFGISLIGYMVVACVVPFYNPPASQQAQGARSLVSSGMLIALVLFLTRAVDLIADPLAGYVSDRTHSRWGRRKPFMLVSAPLLVIAVILLWHPPVGHPSDANAWYAGILLTAVFICFAAYAAPYLGLLPEIARTPDERVKLATVQGLFHLLGTTTAALTTGMLCPIFGMPRIALVLGLLSLASLWLACLGPHETEAEAKPHGRELGLGRALRITLTNWPFLIYWAGYYLFWVPLLVIIAGMEFAAARWLDAGPGAAGSIAAIPLVGGLLFLPLAKWLTEHHSPRWTFLGGLLWLVLTAPLLGLIGLPHDHAASVWQARGLAALLSPAVAVLFTVPYTVLADICDLDYRRSGKHREAMYFGFQGLMLKAGWGIAPLIAALIIRLFQRGELGYHLMGPAAGAMALLGFVIFWFYPERRVRGNGDPG